MPIPGTTSTAAHVGNLGAQDMELSCEDIQSIDDIAPERTTIESSPRPSAAGLRLAERPYCLRMLMTLLDAVAPRHSGPGPRRGIVRWR
jgi:hypothetical protein